MSIIYEDFIGLTFKGIHTSELNLVRVSRSDRYEDLLSPTFKDETLDIPGRAGLIYLDTKTQQKSFSIDFAFDNVNEVNLRKIRNLFQGEGVYPLSFDEAPYKEYIVKVSSTPRISYLCFDDPETGERVYRGELEVKLDAYYPYARAPFKTLGEYEAVGLENVDEWAEASRIRSNLGGYDSFSTSNNTSTAKLYNPGDLPTPVQIIFKENNVAVATQIRLGSEVKIKIEPGFLTTGQYYRLNGNLGLLEGGTWSSGNKTFTPNGQLYNGAISGEFFSLEAMNDLTESINLYVTTGEGIHVSYDYLYY